MTDGCRSRNILAAPFVIFIVLFHRFRGVDGTPARLAADHSSGTCYHPIPFAHGAVPSVPVANMDVVNLSSLSYFRHSTDFFSDGYTKAPQIWGRTVPPSIILPAGDAIS